VSRFDKYSPVDGGFRAPLNAAIPAGDIGKIIGVSLNGTGKVVYGGATAVSIKGVICPTRAMAAGEPIDVMTDGEITMATFSDLVTPLLAGTDYYATATALSGVLTATTTSNQYVGHTVEATRLVVRVGR
jgi:hypothetical protein